MKKEHLLAEVDEVLRTRPPETAFGGVSKEPLTWVGRACAVIERWNVLKSFSSSGAANDLQSPRTDKIAQGYAALLVLLNQARADLRMDVGPLTSVIEHGHVFAFFEEVRRLSEMASSDLMFVDPYLDADFVGIYLPHVAAGVNIRLLTADKKLATLLPAVEMFVKQSKASVQVRSSRGLHDRFLFVDRNSGYVLGASFKDGAKNAPALLAQILDAFQSLWETYDRKWQAGAVHR